MNQPPQAIILAAGQGTRMSSEVANALPKVVYPVADEPMIRWVVRACQKASATKCIVVIGYKGHLVREALEGFKDVEFVEQTEQLGTAHATQMASPLFEDRPPCNVFVLAGDGPLIQHKTLVRLLELHRRTSAAATLATAVIDDPTGYGRIVRTTDGKFDHIVEQKDASPDELAIKEVNPSYYCFNSTAMFDAIAQVSAANKQSEFYLTDVPAILAQDDQIVSVIEAVPAEDVLSINTQQQLAQVDRLLHRRLERELTTKETLA